MDNQVYINPLTINKGLSVDKTAIQNWIEQGFEEDYYVELKEYRSQDPQMNDDIRRTISALANSYGGYFILGVADSKNVAPGKKSPLAERIKGIDDKHINTDARNLINNICKTTVLYPRIDNLDAYDVNIDGKRVIVVYVPKVVNGPVGFKKDVSGQVEYYKRINGDSIPMDFNEIKDSFSLSNISLVRAAVHEASMIMFALDRLRETNLGSTIFSVIDVPPVFQDVGNIYKILDLNFDSMTVIMNVKGGIKLINQILEIINESHIRNSSIGKVDKLEKQIKETSVTVDESIKKILSKIHDKYPSVVNEFAESTASFAKDDIM